MPVQDKPLPPSPIEGHVEPEIVTPSADLISQMREAIYSPSPLLKILHDPTLLSTGSLENLRGRSRRASPSPLSGQRRERRSPYVAAAAIAEEERQATHLKALLHASGDRLEYEMRRAEEASARASYSERQEREALAKARAAEAEKQRFENESMRLERDMRNFQIQLEASQRETRRLEDEIKSVEHEMEQLQDSETQAQNSARKYQSVVRDYERQMKERASQMQVALDKWYERGKEDGYNDGYEEGYDDGRRAGLKEGLKRGRSEGVQEGIEQGRNEERRNALEIIDKLLAEDGTSDRERTRRWVRSIYMGDEYAETLGPADSGSVL